MLWTNIWTSFGVFLVIFRYLNEWKSASAKILSEISKDQRFGMKIPGFLAFGEEEDMKMLSIKIRTPSSEVSHTVERNLAESYELQEMKKNFAHRRPKLGRELWVTRNEEEFCTPSSEVSHHVVRNFQKSRIPCFSLFSRFLHLFFRLMPRVYPS